MITEEMINSYLKHRFSHLWTHLLSEKEKQRNIAREDLEAAFAVVGPDQSVRIAELEQKLAEATRQRQEVTRVTEDMRMTYHKAWTCSDGLMESQISGLRAVLDKYAFIREVVKEVPAKIAPATEDEARRAYALYAYLIDKSTTPTEDMLEALNDFIGRRNNPPAEPKALEDRVTVEPWIHNSNLWIVLVDGINLSAIDGFRDKKDAEVFRLGMIAKMKADALSAEDKQI